MSIRAKILRILLLAAAVTAATVILCNMFQQSLREQALQQLVFSSRQAALMLEHHVLNSEKEGDEFLRNSNCRFVVFCRLQDNSFAPIPGTSFPKGYSNYIPTVEDPAIHFHSDDAVPEYTTGSTVREKLLAVSVPTRLNGQQAYCFIGMKDPSSSPVRCLIIILTTTLPLLLAIVLFLTITPERSQLPPPPPQRRNGTEVTDKQLIQLGRLSALRQVTTGIIHEINQPLCVIKGYLGLLQMVAAEQKEKSEDDSTAKYLDICLHNLDRTGNILDHIRSFVREYNAEEENVDFVMSIQNVLDFFGEQFSKRNIKLELKIPERIAPVSASPAMVEQIIVNLLANARDSFQCSGNQEYTAGVKVVTVRLEEIKSAVHFSVEDNGCGMDADTLNHCTDPFFTLAPDKCGLGLSAAKILISKFRGQFKINSIKGRGTSVTVSLPVSKTGEAGK